MRLFSLSFLVVGIFGCGGSVAKQEPAPAPSSSPPSTSLVPPSGDAPPGTPRGCSAVGCVDGLALSLSPSQGWAQGSYRFVIEADGKTETCVGALPLPACSQGRALKCTGPELARIGESGCALGAAEHGFSSIDLPTAPKQVTIHIEREGNPIGGATLTPSYQTSQPNGPGCEPICRQANATIAVTAK